MLFIHCRFVVRVLKKYVPVGARHVRQCPHLNLGPNSIHFDLTLQSTLYKTGSIRYMYDCVCTTNPTYCTYIFNCDRAQFPLFVHVIGHVFVSKSTTRSADVLVWLPFYLLLCLSETKQATSFGKGTLDYKGSGKQTEAVCRSNKVVEARIVLGINMSSDLDSVYFRG